MSPCKAKYHIIGNIKLPFMVNKLHLITNTTARLQPLQLCSGI